MAKKLNVMVATIGGKETTPGTPVSRTNRIALGGFPSLTQIPEKVESGLIAGENISSGKRVVAYDPKGEIPIIPIANGGMGKLLTGLLGTPSTPVKVGAIFRFRYTGSDASNKVTVAVTPDITSLTGVRDAEILDSNFGVSGVLDLTSGTVAAIVSTIDGYTDYDAELVTGLGSVATDIPVAAVFDGKDNWMYILIEDAASTVYAHVWEADLTETERDAMSIQLDGGQDDYLYNGAYVNALTMAAAKKSELTGGVSIVALSRTGSQTPSVLELPNNRTLMFHKGNTAINGIDCETLLKAADIAITNNMNEDGYSEGLSRIYVEKGIMAININMNLRYTTDVYGLLTVAENDTVVPVTLQYKGQEIVDSIDEMLIFELAYCQVDSYTEENDNGNIDSAIGTMAISPKGTKNSPVCQVIMLTTDSAAY